MRRLRQIPSATLASVHSCRHAWKQAWMPRRMPPDSTSCTSTTEARTGLSSRRAGPAFYVVCLTGVGLVYPPRRASLAPYRPPRQSDFSPIRGFLSFPDR